ncbi:OprO/OprP family phosphate-selective porin [Longimicrobium sp.]|uniref:OprO/OprP family phosphate-selective porin n=1 Tax=Longimicrobium sp. TaxID=2029185 RepID=UPI002CF64352|nr:porin [Longimicrobium sp.]HSU16568.1 porin [Longimicrobium sp.]
MRRNRTFAGAAALWAALALVPGGAAAQGASASPPAEGPAAAPADTAEPGDTAARHVEELEQRVRILERRLELDHEAAAAAKASASTLTAGPEGVQFRSADGAYAVSFRGYVHSDGRFFVQGAAKSASTLELRRVRPILEGTVARHYGFRLMADFGEGKVLVQDAYLDARLFPFLRVRTGKFKPPIGLERLQSATALAFVERALPTALVPNRDVGVQLWGDVGGGAVSYAAGVFNGVADGASGDLDADGRKEVAGRVFAQPFRNRPSGFLRGWGFGVAASHGSERGSAAAPGLASYKSPGQQTFFAWRANGQAAGTAIAGGAHDRISPQAFFYRGPLGVLAEHVTSRQQVRRDTSAARLTSRAWQVAAGYVLTGEDASFAGVRPRQAFDPSKHAPGAIELTARLSALEADPHAFPLFADPARSARAAREWAVGANWYLNRNVKVTLDYGRTRFRGGAADGGDRQAEEGILTRLQLAF